MPSYSDIPPPRAKIVMATINDQKYSSLPWPKGCVKSGGRRLWRRPNKSNAPLPVSTSEWIPSDSIAELPENVAATNLVTATATFPMMAATIATLDSAAPLFDTQTRVYLNSATSEHRVALLFTGVVLTSLPRVDPYS